MSAYLNVNASREEVRADEVAAEASPEVVEHAVPVCLRHLGVDVVAAVSQLRDLLGQKLDSLGRVAKDDALIDLEFKEKEPLK